jgi:DNA-binding CsgD family transcriptional regulator
MPRHTKAATISEVAAAGSELERAFDTQLLALGGDLREPIPNYKFLDDRGWRIDRAWPPERLGIELHGGGHGYPVVCHNCGVRVRARTAKGPGREVRIGGFHARHDRFLSDIDKLNQAQLNGWTILTFTRDNVIGDPWTMVETIRQALHCRATCKDSIETISPRELECLYLVAAGFVTPEIAERMQLAENTVRGLVTNICEKLVSRNRPAAVARAIAWKVIDIAQVPWRGEVTIQDEDDT